MNRDELREALVDVIADNLAGDHHHVRTDMPDVRTRARETVTGPVADALLAGPVGDLLAENERLRKDYMTRSRTAGEWRQDCARAEAERDEAHAEVERLRVALHLCGLEKQQTADDLTRARASLSIEELRADDIAEDCDRFESERDALRAQVAAVAALADEWERALNDTPNATGPEKRAVGQFVADIRTHLDDPDRALRDRDAEKWDEGYNAQTDFYDPDATGDDFYEPTNPYREQGSKS